jgi:hypothetical protein
MTNHANAVPLRMRLSSPEERLRVLLLTNEDASAHAPGQRDGFARLQDDGSIEAVTLAVPKVIADSKGEPGALREILEIIRAKRPNVIVQITPQGFSFTEDWFRAVAAALPRRPLLLFWEGDAWSRWSKPVPPETQLWWKHADVVFSVAFGEQRRLIERLGGRDVRFVPSTYDHIRYREEEATEPPTQGDFSEVVVIGNWWGNRYFISRLPGARQRFRLVRALQKDTRIPLAIYGQNWTGRGVRSPVPMADQAAVARRGLITANWDHFPNYAASTSDRLPIQLLAGRAHVTTLHPGSEWLPGPETGLFREPTVGSAIRRVRELLSRPREEVLELGLSAHRWVRYRLSDREFARYMLGAVDERLLLDLPDDPWSRLPV